MSLSTKPYKGARDYYPEDLRVRNYLFDTMRRVVRSYGYEEYDAPVLEPVDLYKAKTGEEIVNEQTYSFTDRGDRDVALRPEMTPTVSRLVAGRRQELGYPLRLFNVGPRWRYERQQRGRYREFFQLDVDLFGVDSLDAELEVIQVADDLLKSFGAKPNMYKIRVNSREFIDHLLHDYLKFDTVQAYSVIKLIDRMHKMDSADFEAQLDALCTPTQREHGTVEALQKVLTARNIGGIPDVLRTDNSVKVLETLLKKLSDNGLHHVEFDASLMRGFDYYTGVVFEVFDIDPENNRSMFGGGRYDGLVGLFGVEPVPTIGFAMGDATLMNFLQTHDLLPKLKPETHVYVAVMGDVQQQAQKAVAELRQEGINVAVDISGKKLDKQLKTADKKGIQHVIVIGQQELDSNQFTLKNLKTGHQESHSLSRIVSILEDHRKSDQ